MEQVEFEALGTRWAILMDADRALGEVFGKLRERVERFEQRYSRFIEMSVISEINRGEAGSWEIDSDLEQMLRLGKELEQVTHGRFRMNVTGLLEAYGYDEDYSFKESKEAVEDFGQGIWEVKEGRLIKEASVKLDLGSLGKGHLMDLLAKVLREAGGEYFLIDGGGDMYGSVKQTQQPWKIALAYPGREGEALGTLEIKQQGFAASGSDRRRVGNWHHLLDVEQKKPVDEILAVFVVADSAMVADGCATGLFVAGEEYWEAIRQQFEIEYLVVRSDTRYECSVGFTGELFVKGNDR